MTPDLRDLEAFAAVARHSSFRKAAAERGVSPSALSHTLRSLEERLGVRLLHRSTRSVMPTEAGSYLLSRLGPALDTVADTLADLVAFQHEPAGTIRLNVPRPAIKLIIAPLISRFVLANPRIQMDVVADDSFTDIVGNGFDAGIRFGESLAKDMIAVPIGPQVGFVCVASPSYLSRKGTPASPRDLVNHDCLGRRFPNGNCYEWEFQANKKPFKIEVNGPLTLDDDELMIRCSCDGIGISYVYEALARERIMDGELISLLDSYIPSAGNFYLYFSGRKNLPPALRAFLDFIRE